MRDNESKSNLADIEATLCRIHEIRTARNREHSDDEQCTTICIERYERGRPNDHEPICGDSDVHHAQQQTPQNDYQIEIVCKGIRIIKQTTTTTTTKPIISFVFFLLLLTHWHSAIDEHACRIFHRTQCRACRQLCRQLH